eukprot:TRINITY_DN18387_c0_g1_i1.p1 TRINITY_DN18387_c0_g1~~TRINITY_DN18387_c0_g1_i1.p1  ORF type:complete len:463 (+),score=77.33 TRINITY_DN18387_c0_g1_i1:123-1511(+)
MKQVTMLDASKSSSLCYDEADTAWVTISSVLVLGMMPALALFEAGMLRSKNTLSIITQVLSGLSVLQILWHVIGFTLTFDKGNGFIGGFKYFLYFNIQHGECTPNAPHIPGLTFALFQSMFAAITPLLITGAFAERLKFKPFLFFVVAWEVIVYYPLAHWIWGGGWLSDLPVLDFAGGIVIHTSAGISSLIISIMLGRRLQFNRYHGEFPPHNLPLATIGAALLWIGWYGFNAGSALTVGHLSANAISTTTIAAAVSAVIWMILSYAKFKRPHTVAILNGAIAGLAGITPASGYIASYWAILVGAIIGVAAWYGIVLLKEKLRIDDALDVTSVHGITGAVGSIAIGFFASKDINADGENGGFYGNWMQLPIQLAGVGVAMVWAGFWTFVIVWGMMQVKDWTGFCIVRANEIDEEVGLDKKEHGNVAYRQLFTELEEEDAIHEEQHGVIHGDKDVSYNTVIVN